LIRVCHSVGRPEKLQPHTEASDERRWQQKDIEYERVPSLGVEIDVDLVYGLERSRHRVPVARARKSLDPALCCQERDSASAGESAGTGKCAQGEEHLALALCRSGDEKLLVGHRRGELEGEVLTTQAVVRNKKGGSAVHVCHLRYLVLRAAAH
jgi:hypothetical protein